MNLSKFLSISFLFYSHILWLVVVNIVHLPIFCVAVTMNQQFESFLSLLRSHSHYEKP